MELTIQTTETKAVEAKIPVPCYLYDSARELYHFVNESGDLVTVGNHTVSYWPKEYDVTQKQIHAAWKNCNSCVQADFKTALDKVLFKVEEVYTK